MRAAQVIRELLRDERGQNSVEYAIVAAAIVFTLVFVIGTFSNSIAAFHQDVTSVVCLPVP